MLQRLDWKFKKRHHLFEIGDQPWLPRYFRDELRDFLGASHRVMGYYKPLAKVLADELRKSGQREVVVLGGGGVLPIQLLQKELRLRHKLEVKFYLTDLYPVPGQIKHLKADDDIVCVEEPVNMLQIPPTYRGLRLIVNAFHHLKPEQAEATLQAAYESGTSICVFEFTRNSFLGVFTSMFYPLFNLVIAPLIRPFRLSRLALYYVIPVLPLLHSFDGLMSNFRTYGKEEFREMVRPFVRTDYEWEHLEPIAPLHPTLLTIFVGRPLSSENKS